MGFTYTDQTETTDDKILIYTTTTADTSSPWVSFPTEPWKSPTGFYGPPRLKPPTIKEIDEMMQAFKMRIDEANKRTKEATLERQDEIYEIYNHTIEDDAERLSKLQDEECRRLVEETEVNE